MIFLKFHVEFDASVKFTELSWTSRKISRYNLISLFDRETTPSQNRSHALLSCVRKSFTEISFWIKTQITILKTNI